MNKLAEIIYKDAENICKNIDFKDIFGKTVMITGASGLIGNYFLACLKKISTNERSSIKTIAVMQNEPLNYLEVFLDYPGAEKFFGDLSDYEFCRKLPEADFIIHVAGYGQPGRFMEDRVKTLKLNTFSTFLLFEKLNPKGKFLFASSSEVYSGLPNPPYKEGDIGITNTTHPRSCYIEAKRCGEAICNAYREKGADAKSVRLSLAYGPGTKAGDRRVLNNFIYKGICGEIDLLDRGLANRTYCYVSDAVEIMWNVLLKGGDAVYNIGGDSKITIGDLAKKIGKHMNVPVVFPENTENSVVGAPEDVSLDMSKVKSEFKKTKFISLDDGLAKTIEWQRELYKK